MPDWKYPVLVFVGGGVGSTVRYLLGRWVADASWAKEFPWVTFAINAVGSFALGVLAVACANRPGWRALLGVGVCGGFTTFSTFSVETLHLIQAGRPWAAGGYVGGSVLAGLAGAWAGWQLAGGR